MDKSRERRKSISTGKPKSYRQDRRIILKFVPKLRKVKKGGN